MGEALECVFGLSSTNPCHRSASDPRHAQRHFDRDETLLHVWRLLTLARPVSAHGILAMLCSSVTADPVATLAPEALLMDAFSFSSPVSPGFARPVRCLPRPRG